MSCVFVFRGFQPVTNRTLIPYSHSQRLAIFCRDIKEVQFESDKTLDSFMRSKNKITVRMRMTCDACVLAQCRSIHTYIS